MEWYSTMGNDVDVSLTTKSAVAVPAGADLTYRTWYEIEAGYDHGFVEVSDDDGATWDTLVDYSDVDTDHWADTQTVDLSAYEGKDVLVRFEYYTDGGVALRGWEVTDVMIGATALGESAWETDGWVRVDGEWKQKTERYYIAEYRNYDGSDAEPQELLPVELQLRELGRLVQLQQGPPPHLPRHVLHRQRRGPAPGARRLDGRGLPPQADERGVFGRHG